MNFNKLLQFINKKKVNNNFKILYLIILALFIFFLSYFYSLEPDIEARDFLPKETSFYYEWVDVNNNIHIFMTDFNEESCGMAIRFILEKNVLPTKIIILVGP